MEEPTADAEVAEPPAAITLPTAEPGDLLEAVTVTAELWVTTLGSVGGMGFPSLVCSFTTCTMYK